MKARVMAAAQGLPLIPVHHMEAHALVARLPPAEETGALPFRSRGNPRSSRLLDLSGEEFTAAFLSIFSEETQSRSSNSPNVSFIAVMPDLRPKATNIAFLPTMSQRTSIGVVVNCRQQLTCDITRNRALCLAVHPRRFLRDRTRGS